MLFLLNLTIPLPSKIIANLKSPQIQRIAIWGLDGRTLVISSSLPSCKCVHRGLQLTSRKLQEPVHLQFYCSMQPKVCEKPQNRTLFITQAHIGRDGTGERFHNRFRISEKNSGLILGWLLYKCYLTTEH